MRVQSRLLRLGMFQERMVQILIRRIHIGVSSLCNENKENNKEWQSWQHITGQSEQKKHGVGYPWEQA
uniref:Uncharacterized protein n=1 Tax=Picea glauca TaxID=3330 RepID=A0A117NGM3_PICGL|nr:hypothetical protein ABT39_MTgene6021 [Picea glauca]QHR86827.1 hypothetical protein Q903MT_gene834 [Picea sitchensis]